MHEQTAELQQQLAVLTLKAHHFSIVQSPYRSMSLLKRRTSAFRTTAAQCSIVSYNLLGDAYAMDPLEPDLYDHAAEAGVLNWNVRLKLIRQEIKSYNADIVALQEATLKSFKEDFEDYFAEEYGSILQNDENRAVGHPIGNAILFKKDKFSCVWTESRSRSVLCALKWLHFAKPASVETKTVSASEFDSASAASASAAASAPAGEVKSSNQRKQENRKAKAEAAKTEAKTETKAESAAEEKAAPKPKQEKPKQEKQQKPKQEKAPKKPAADAAAPAPAPAAGAADVKTAEAAKSDSAPSSVETAKPKSEPKPKKEKQEKPEKQEKQQQQQQQKPPKAKKGGDAKQQAPAHDGSPLLWIINVHLEGDPQAGEKRFQQLKSSFKSLRAKQVQFKEKPEASDTLVVGDFNCSTDSGVYQLLSTGKLPAGFSEGSKSRTDGKKNVVTKEDFKHEYAFRSAYAEAGGEPFATFVMKQWNDCIDFIFYNSPAFRLRSVMQMLSPDHHIFNKTFLPCSDFPSDHIAIGCVLERTADAKATSASSVSASKASAAVSASAGAAAAAAASGPDAAVAAKAAASIAVEELKAEVKAAASAS